MGKRLFAGILALALAAPMLCAGRARAAYEPQPTTAYGASFVAACEGQQWFIEEVERLLNAEQKTLDTVTGSADFSGIVGIGLQNKGIEGKIPAAIGELKELRGLFLPGNALGGTIPEELYTLPKLENVDLSGNRYSGTIPAGFGTMPALTTLTLRGNDYSGSVPNTLLSNTVITGLDLSSNRLSGNTLADFTTMTGLRYLNLSGNDLRGAMPDVSAWTQMVSLSLWDCGLTGDISDTLYGLGELQILDLSGNALTGGVSASIAGLTKLRYLALDNNRLRGTLPDAFAMPELARAHFEHNYLRGMAPDTLKAREDAGAEIYMNDNYMTGATLKGMANNSGNFADGAASGQYQLQSTAVSVHISKTGDVNLYALMKNKALADGMPAKALLKPTEYTTVYDAEKLTVTANDTGIYVRAKTDIPLASPQTLSIQIKDNDGSDYSRVRITVATEQPAAMGGAPGISATLHTPYINGYPDGRFGPEENLTREQAAKLLAAAMDCEPITPETPTFSDVTEDAWSYAWIEAAAAEGYVTGYDGQYAPTRSITRAELATILARVAAKRGLALSDEAVSFSDVAEDMWYCATVQQAARYGLVTGYPDGAFRPEATVTRAEAVTMVNRLLARNAKSLSGKQTLACPFSDVTENHWAYWEILEAAVQHTH